ncbi:MaoC family dehydratase [Vibrio sp.]|nr:MaoC family dehydratase [Vibrio sp.]
MKVVDLLKHRAESVSKYHLDFIHRMKGHPVRDYLYDLKLRSNQRSFLMRLKQDYTATAINEDTVQPDLKLQPKIELKPEAAELYHELQAKVDTVIHTGDWFDVSQERINQFGDVTEDRQWIHTDPVRAEKESPFKTTVAHGFFTLALLPKLTDSVDPEKNLFPTARSVINIGLNNVRFPYPVKVGSRLRAVSTLTRIEPIKKGLEIEREIKVEIEGVRRPAAIVSSIIQLHF